MPEYQPKIQYVLKNFSDSNAKVVLREDAAVATEYNHPGTDHFDHNSQVCLA